MKSNINYIDKLTVDHLKSFEYTPKTTWSLFNKNHSVEFIHIEKPNKSIISNFTTKNVMFTVAGISVLTAGILLNGYENNKKGLKSIDKSINTERTYVLPNQNITNDVSEFVNVSSEINTKDTTIEQDEENVVVRVVVPIVKNVEIKEKLFIKDKKLDTQKDTVISH